MCANQVKDGKRIIIMGTKRTRTNRKRFTTTHRHKNYSFSLSLTIESSNVHPLYIDDWI